LRINLISKLTIATSLILLIFMLLFAYVNIITLKDMLLEAAISDADKLSETIIKTTHYEMLEDKRTRAYEMIREVGTLEGVEHIRMIVSFRQACVAGKSLSGARLGGKRSPCLPVVAL